MNNQRTKEPTLLETLKQASISARLIDDEIGEMLAWEANKRMYTEPMPDFETPIRDRLLELMHHIYVATRSEP